MTVFNVHYVFNGVKHITPITADNPTDAAKIVRKRHEGCTVKKVKVDRSNGNPEPVNFGPGIPSDEVELVSGYLAR